MNNRIIISQYLDALAQQRLCNNVREEVDSFLKGLNGIIPDNLLSIFDENELEVQNSLFYRILSNANCDNYSAPSMWNGRIFNCGFPCPSHCKWKFARVPACARLVLGGN